MSSEHIYLPGPPLYLDPNRTSSSIDSKIFFILLTFTTAEIAFLLVLPGIRKEKLICVKLTSMKPQEKMEDVIIERMETGLGGESSKLSPIIINNKPRVKKKGRVNFMELTMVTIFYFEDSIEDKECRSKYWEFEASDRDRFKNRIMRTEEQLTPILSIDHRNKIFQQRFDIRSTSNEIH